MTIAERYLTLSVDSVGEIQILPFSFGYGGRP